MLYLLLLGLHLLSQVVCTRILKINEKKEIIRIIQFADLHFGENLYKDKLTLQLMNSVIKNESPDFAVFSGDQISGYEVFSLKEKLLLWEKALSIVSKYRIPFATIFGNHDDQPYQLDLLLWNTWAYYVLYIEFLVCIVLFAFMRKKRKDLCLKSIFFFMIFILIGCIYVSTPSTNVRLALITHEHQKYPTLSYTDIGPENVNGISNYRVILKSKLTGRSVSLFFIDSGGGMIENKIHPNQLQWLNTFQTETIENSLAFIHVAPIQYHSMYFTHKCKGKHPKESTSKCPGSERLLNTLYSIGVRALFVGHDHGNEWCCNKDNMLLCYGKHSGFGGYDFNETNRGVRIIDVNVSSGSFTTWISLWDSISDLRLI